MDHGELRVTKGTATQLLAVSGGFVQVVDDKVSVLAEGAITEEKIDEHAVEAAMKRAEDALKGQDPSNPPRSNASKASSASPSPSWPSSAAAAERRPSSVTPDSVPMKLKPRISRMDTVIK